MTVALNDDHGGTPSRPESRQPNPKPAIGTIEQQVVSDMGFVGARSIDDEVQ